MTLQGITCIILKEKYVLSRKEGNLMLNLLNGVNLFGKDVNLSAEHTAIWLIIIQALIIIGVVSIIIYYIVHQKFKKKANQDAITTVSLSEANTEVIHESEPIVEVQRELVGILIDLGMVKREFRAGDEFSCYGLVVQAEYNLQPTFELINNYTLIDNDTYLRLKKRDKLHGVYVIKPYMYTAGVKVVAVRYENHVAEYTISLCERNTKMVEETDPIIEAVQTECQHGVQKIELNVQDDAAPLPILEEQNVAEENNETVKEALIQPEILEVEKTVEVEEPAEQASNLLSNSPDTYSGKDVEETVEYQIMENAASKEDAEPSRIEDDPEVSYQEVVEEQNSPNAMIQHADPLIVEEESVTSVLRYDRSFMARLIQSEDEIKYWYTDIKNELLSYKGVKGRMSWKRETFKCGGKLVLAKLAYRGKVLCIFLPLNPADYGEEYPVENASDKTCYEDTPLMIRLKNSKRMDLARELINTVMERNKMVRVKHESVDYYVPYEGILDLINKGLAKRNIRTSEDEAIFARDLNTDDDENDTLTLTKVAPGIYVTKKE